LDPADARELQAVDVSLEESLGFNDKLAGRLGIGRRGGAGGEK